MTNKIEILKKEFWDRYTPLMNEHFEAFELMRQIGVAQGKYLEKHKK